METKIDTQSRAQSRVCGIDIGNSTTEAVIMEKIDGSFHFLGYGIVPTTGVKGTKQNKIGAVEAFNKACAGLDNKKIDKILINEATPVISELSTDIVSQTAVIGSSMIGHNPDTPGGNGLGIGYTALVERLSECEKNKEYIAVIGKEISFEEAARLINQATEAGISIAGAIAQNDDGVLISNRLSVTIPIVDEVSKIHKIPINQKAAVEVAGNSETVKILSNPYGIAGIFGLSPEETKAIAPSAKSLMGLRSGVVIKNEYGSVEFNKINVGSLFISADNGEFSLNVADGAEIITETVTKCGKIFDVSGEKNTNTGKMFDNIKKKTAELTGIDLNAVKISDVSAADTFAPIKVEGGLADEYAMESVVMLSAMVKTQKLLMSQIADEISKETGVSTEVMGKEADNAIIGALTTTGAAKPAAILDLGGGSTDAACIDIDGNIISAHTAGAGEMVTTMINLELSLDDRELAEEIKKYPLARVETFNMLRFEDQTVKFTQAQLPSELYKRVVIIREDKLIPILKKNVTMEQIALIRKEAKRKVFVTNAVKALSKVTNNLKNIDFVILIGGSAMDFEIPTLLNEALSKYNIVCGKGNVLSKFGPRAAVAAGLTIHNSQCTMHNFPAEG